MIKYLYALFWGRLFWVNYYKNDAYSWKFFEKSKIYGKILKKILEKVEKSSKKSILYLNLSNSNDSNFYAIFRNNQPGNFLQHKISRF